MLKLENICYDVDADRPDRAKRILSDVSLEFPDRSLTVITGHNGSGKSTLVKLIMGIDKPTSGRILFNGADVTGDSVTDRALKGFTIAFQQPVRFKGITVRNLLDAACRRKCSTGDACNFLYSVGLCAKDYIDRPVDDTLSGGELKRIELATALAKGGEVFLPVCFFFVLRHCVPILTGLRPFIIIGPLIYFFYFCHSSTSVMRTSCPEISCFTILNRVPLVNNTSRWSSGANLPLNSEISDMSRPFLL